MRIFQFSLAFMLIAVGTGHVAAEAAKVPEGTPVNEIYRKEFARCDKEGKFENANLPILSKKIDPRTGRQNILWYSCTRDHNLFSRFEDIRSVDGRPAAVLIESKLGHDNDGSPLACTAKKGPTDQCGTTLMLNPTKSTPCILPRNGKSKCVPLNAEKIPYVVIPAAAPPGVKANEFHDLSGVSVGDYGVVIANGKEVPIVVGDTGPAYKIGEGSSALLRRLSDNGSVSTISHGVILILFKGTHDAVADLNPDTFVSVVDEKGRDYFEKLIGRH